MKRILEVQKEIGSLSKSAKNPFFKSAYLDLNDLLNAVQPLLHAKGLLLMQPIKANCVYSSIVDAETGTEISVSELALPDIKDPQKLGSCITYYRRYTLKSLLAIAEKDDDGNHASKPEPKENKVLSDEQFEKAQQGTKAQIDTVLGAFEMTTEQRSILNFLV